MKVRIKGNSVRYRLSMTDVARFARDGYVEEVVDFGKSQLTYALEKGANIKLEAEFANNRITIFMPKPQASEWTSTDRIGFDHTNNGLYLLVEKDFQCLDNVAEDQSDNFPNPNSTC